jgi:hypothetical protein
MKKVFLRIILLFSLMGVISIFGKQYFCVMIAQEYTPNFVCAGGIFYQLGVDYFICSNGTGYTLTSYSEAGTCS